MVEKEAGYPRAAGRDFRGGYQARTPQAGRASMKAFIDVGRFPPYLNAASITLIKPGLITVEVKGKEFAASLIVSAEQDYAEDYTLQFVLRFEHKTPHAEGM